MGQGWIKTLLIGLFLSACCSLSANNVKIKGEAKAFLLSPSTAMITFPLSWENSWRSGENWDAVYLFVKYRRKGENEPWHHLFPNATGHSIGGKSNLPIVEFLPVYTHNSWYLSLDTIHFGNVNPSYGEDVDVVTGLYLFRAKKGEGNIDIPYVSLEWDFAKGGDLALYYDVTAEDIQQGKLEFSVQAIEMVYIPNGPFYAGDDYSYGSFVNETANRAYRVENEDSIPIYMMGASMAAVPADTAYLPGLYPKGYNGFYMMKYEVSQEQYVNFLNRLTYEDQKKHIGNDLDKLWDMQEGGYAFGSDSKNPNFRNGIILLERFQSKDTAVIFGYNLNTDDPYNHLNDGKNIACNFLSPADLRAYADWVGLRPLSELEFEKSARERNPKDPPVRGYAWETPTLTQLNIGALDDAGGENEEPGGGFTTANVNGPQNDINFAPVRNGAFARPGSTKAEETGASRYGALELTGNLAEISYNVYEGKDFNGSAYGDGNIWSTVALWRDSVDVRLVKEFWTGYGTHTLIVSDTLELPTYNKFGHKMFAIVSWKETRQCHSSGCHYWIDHTERIPWPVIEWPDTCKAFASRGGSFASKSQDAMALSYRKEAMHYTDMNTRDRDAGFRVGRSVPMRTDMLVGKIAFASNLLSRDTAYACPAVPCVVKEIDAGDDETESTQFVWEINDGTGWKIIDGAEGRDLSLTDMLNDTVICKSYEIRRRSIASHQESTGNVVTLVVPGYYVDGGEGLTLGAQSSSLNIIAQMGKTGTIRWYDGDAGTLLQTDGPTKEATYVFSRTNFPTVPPAGSEAAYFHLICEMDMGGCKISVTRDILVRSSDWGCDAVADANGTPYQTAALSSGSGRCWFTEDVRTDIAAGSGKGLTWGNSQTVGGVHKYNFKHLLADNAGQIKICPDGWRVATLEDYQREWEAYSVSTIPGMGKTYQGGMFIDGGTGDVDKYMADMNFLTGTWWAASDGGSYPTVDIKNDAMMGGNWITGQVNASIGEDVWLPVRCVKK